MTTSENISLYLEKEIGTEYVVLRVCLKETNNIMAVIEHNIMEG